MSPGPYRACRAAALGAGGHLSGPFEQLPEDLQVRAVLSLLELRSDVALPDPRRTIPTMALLARRHPRLNLLNLEAVAFGYLTGSVMWLAEGTEQGVLPDVLDREQVAWRVVSLAP